MKIEDLTTDLTIKLTLTSQEVKYLIMDLESLEEDTGISWAVTAELLEFLKDWNN